MRCRAVAIGLVALCWGGCGVEPAPGAQPRAVSDDAPGGPAAEAPPKVTPAPAPVPGAPLGSGPEPTAGSGTLAEARGAVPAEPGLATGGGPETSAKPATLEGPDAPPVGSSPPTPPAEGDGERSILFSSVVEIDGAATKLVVTKEEREIEDDYETVVLAKLFHTSKVFAFRQRGFEEHVHCEAPKLVDSPPGMTILATDWCDPWSCGGGCLRTRQVLYIPHAAPAKGRWYELSCNENLSVYPDSEVNDACDRLDVSGRAAEIMLETTSSKPCAEGDDSGNIRRATVRRSTISMSPTGAELRPGKIEPYRKDLWGCPEAS